VNFNKNLLWIEQGPKLLLLGLEDNLVLVVTGPLKSELLDNLKNGLTIRCSLSETELATFGALLLSANLLEGSPEIDVSQNELVPALFGNGSEITFIDLVNKAEEDFKEYAIFAKNVDPTSISGPGGFDDDAMPSPVGTMFAPSV
jgi:hypothetical protein